MKVVDAVINGLKKHTTIRTKAILIVYVIIVFYKFSYSLFQFSLVRFLKTGLGKETFLIGLMLALANFILIFSDVPLGIIQKYIRPRIFLLVSVSLLLFSDLIFLFSSLNIWLGFIAVFLQQASMEIFFITITTYILRLSTKADYAQNVAQADIADNMGDILGLGIGGLVFVADRFFAASNMFAASFLAILITIVFLFILEFVDRKHYSSLESYILSLKVSKIVTSQAEKIEESIVQEPSAHIPASEENVTTHEKKKMSLQEIWEGFRNTFGNLFDIITNRLHVPMMIWGMVVLIVTYFWYYSINFFEPMFMKEVYSQSEGWVAENVPRYLFESFMFIIALVVPTFLMELPFSKLADQWGKERMIILGTLFSGCSILFLGLINTPFMVFLGFLAINCGFVMIYPAIVGLFGEQYKKAMKKKKSEENVIPQIESQENAVEGESAGVISIIVNVGEISAGLVGGLFLAVFTFGVTYIIYGVFLILLGILSILAFKYIFPLYNKEDKIPSETSDASPPIS